MDNIRLILLHLLDFLRKLVPGQSEVQETRLIDYVRLCYLLFEMTPSRSAIENLKLN